MTRQRGGCGMRLALALTWRAEQDGKQTSDREDDATRNDSAEDVPKAIAGVNYLIAGVPHPIKKPLRLRTCKSIPPPHGEMQKPLQLGAIPPSGGSKSVQFALPPPYCATPPLGGSKLVRLASPPPYGAIPPSSDTMTVNWKSGSQPPPNDGVVVPQATQALERFQPPILEQTGGLLTGAETDKLRLQNRRRRHALQEQQVPTTLRSTHTGHASLPP